LQTAFLFSSTVFSQSNFTPVRLHTGQVPRQVCVVFTERPLFGFGIRSLPLDHLKFLHNQQSQNLYFVAATFWQRNTFATPLFKYIKAFQICQVFWKIFLKFF